MFQPTPGLQRDADSRHNVHSPPPLTPDPREIERWRPVRFPGHDAITATRGPSRTGPRSRGREGEVGSGAVPLSPLPIDDVMPALLGGVERAGAAVLIAPPGAGKTTRVPG